MGEKGKMNNDDRSYERVHEDNEDTCEGGNGSSGDQKVVDDLELSEHVQRDRLLLGCATGRHNLGKYPT